MYTEYFGIYYDEEFLTTGQINRLEILCEETFYNFENKLKGFNLCLCNGMNGQYVMDINNVNKLIKKSEEKL